VWGDSLQEAGDVIAAAGGPDEGVGLHGDVVGHQLGGLLAARPTGVAHAVVVHPKPEAGGAGDAESVSGRNHGKPTPTGRTPGW